MIELETGIINALLRHQFFMCYPFLSILRASMTKILSAWVIVDSLWATMSVVRSGARRSSDSWMSASLSRSNAEVASSKISNGGFLRTREQWQSAVFDRLTVSRLAPRPLFHILLATFR